ncbi:MAG: recombination mediator RecR [Oscillospiraceae bacterium]|nr:recombination mediator RecR [Oscillospiraceae bacterium]MCL2278873.1 recombination mediator RecR [Oscillospiraceae bacterium]
MDFFPSALENLIDKFAMLPGIGRKTAQRLAFYMIAIPDEDAISFADTIKAAKRGVKCCTVCLNLTDGDLCSVCKDTRRNTKVVCVVPDPKGVLAIERSHEFDGLYHVLHGVISPIGNIGPDDIKIKELIARVSDGGIDEVIMATNPDTEGETTARYISRLLHPFGVKVTRLAYGIPVGGSLEFVDDATLMRALEGRMEM